MDEARQARHERHDRPVSVADLAVVGASVVTATTLGFTAGRSTRTASSLKEAGPEAVLLIVVMLVLVVLVLWQAGRSRHSRHQASMQRLTGSLVEALDSVQEQQRHRAQLTHDARNACAGVRASLEILADHGSELDDDSAARLRELALYGLVHLEEVIARSDPSLRDFAATEIVRRVADGRRLLGSDVAVLGDDVWAHGRPHDFATALLNMLVNAELHADGTTVTVDVGSRDGMVRVCVSDGGPGVAAEHAQSVFDRGWRGAGSDGHGLGLHTARTLMRDQAGDVTLVPATRGASFLLSLPAGGREVADLEPGDAATVPGPATEVPR